MTILSPRQKLQMSYTLSNTERIYLMANLDERRSGMGERSYPALPLHGEACGGSHKGFVSYLKVLLP